MAKVLVFVSVLLIGTPLLGQAEWNQEAALGLVNAQLSAYNQRDIEAFVMPYSDSVKVFQHPEQLLFRGKEQFRGTYADLFGRLDSLHCEIVNRMVFSERTIIDQERVTGVQNGVSFMFEAIAIYKIWDEKIQEVYFIQQ
ncbi:MAG: nuclear transport factor 2 family protein [Phaeodactylibacter sp.]|nr:nuclear transport factor 2 family protein [Phaeodactylibacter sp.]